MNWRELDEQWKRFAESKDSSISPMDNHHFLGIKTKYELGFNDESGSTIYSGFLHKNNGGYNLNGLKIIVSPIDPFNIQPRLIERKTGLLSFLKKKKYKTFTDEKLAQILKKINGKRLSINRTKFQIDLEYIPSKEEDFVLLETGRQEILNLMKASR